MRMNPLQAMTNLIFSKLALVADRRVYARPELFGLVASTIEARRPDGTVLRGYKIPAPTTSAADDGAAPVVVFLSGNTGNVSAHFPYVEMLHRAGCHVIAFDYAGFGLSDGKRDLDKLIVDANTACDAARREFGSSMEGEFKIGLFGLSIGANIAIALAAQRDDILGAAVEGLSIQREIIRGITVDGRAGPWNINELTLDGEPLAEREFVKFPGLRGPGFFAAFMGAAAHHSYPLAGKDPRVCAGVARAPLLVIHGTTDRIFPFEGAVETYRRSGPKSRLWLLPGVGHAQEPALNSDDEYVAQLHSFFHQNEPTSGAMLVTKVREDRVDFRRIWLEPGESFPAEDKQESDTFVTLLGMHCVERTDTSWRALKSERAQLFESTYGEYMRQLSRDMHAQKILPAAETLTAFAELEPPFPYSHIGALHAARLEGMAEKKAPGIAALAEELFGRFQSTTTRVTSEVGGR